MPHLPVCTSQTISARLTDEARCAVAGRARGLGTCWLDGWLDGRTRSDGIQALAGSQMPTVGKREFERITLLRSERRGNAPDVSVRM